MPTKRRIKPKLEDTSSDAAPITPTSMLPVHGPLDKLEITTVQAQRKTVGPLHPQDYTVATLLSFARSASNIGVHRMVQSNGYGDPVWTVFTVVGEESCKEMVEAMDEVIQKLLKRK